MARFLVAGGWTAVFLGVGLILPVAVARWEGAPPTGLALGLVLAGGALIASGGTALLAGVGRRRGPSLPGGVRMAVAVNVLFLAFFALELSDGLVRQGGRVVYWTTFLFLPALLLLVGLLSARRWAWWTCRVLAAVSVLWFLGFVAMIPFADLRGAGGPVPWHGRLYMACVSLAFAGILAGAFWSLGRPEVRGYFGLARPERECVR